MEKRYISYFRVSTQKQGANGLGLDAQREAVNNYLDGKSVVSEFIEIESGTSKKKRIEIYKAIDLANELNAVLIVAKLDRLSRDVEFTSALYNSKIEFICVDNPTANKLTIQILSVMAEHETEAISKRTREALAVKMGKISKGDYINKDGSTMSPDKSGNYRLGNPDGFADRQHLGLEAIKRNSENNKANLQALGVICDKRALGMSYRAIASYLNDLGYKTRYGKLFTPMQVQRLYKRC